MSFSPKKANVHLIRSSLFGCAVAIQAADTGIPVGNLGAKNYLSWQRNPGVMDRTVSAPSWIHDTDMQMTVEAGRDYYIKAEIISGMWTSNLGISMMSETKGKRLLAGLPGPHVLVDRGLVAELDALAPSGGAQIAQRVHAPDLPVLPELVTRYYKYDSESLTGIITVECPGIQYRDWMVSEVEKVVESKEITLVTGENRKPGYYQITDESYSDGLLTLHFLIVY